MEGQVVQKRSMIMKISSFVWLYKSIITEAISFLFIILFLYTGISKFREFDIFQEQLAESPVTRPIAAITAWGIPITEFIISILLFFPRYRLIGFYSTFILMLLFTAYIITLFTISPELPCSCGGIIEQLSWTGHLIFNSALILLAFMGIKIQKAINRAKNQ